MNLEERRQLAVVIGFRFELAISDLVCNHTERLYYPTAAAARAEIAACMQRAGLVPNRTFGHSDSWVMACNSEGETTALYVINDLG